MIWVLKLKRNSVQFSKWKLSGELLVDSLLCRSLGGVTKLRVSSIA